MEPLANRLTANLNRSVHQIDDPVVVDAGPGIDASLETAIHAEARVCHLDDEGCRRRMARRSVTGAAKDDGNVRLRLGITSQRQR
jgi:hypothetical protein